MESTIPLHKANSPRFPRYIHMLILTFFYDTLTIIYLRLMIVNKLSGQRCFGRNYEGGKRCCTPENPCGEGEGDCDGPGDGGQHDGHAGCRGNLVCGSNNCKKFADYYHEKDDCCERPNSGIPQGWGSWSSWSACSRTHQWVTGRCRKTRTRHCQGQGCRASQELQVWKHYE